ncbi:Gfo/Idh/MocA family protein [Niabella ginsengisoli]|uniref:Gfo/Idh/MocA family oxidoreductase n=1 Tax=Niabella ginsengisoli TaxID=522298 RepID=A0ABS9SEZ8_9BACT|nr:Gfo/Idh/MocA family oxidoreductase [Niabella ginsengisoli]MCH5596933.1 Gfo/Idh/MocA family oxidoreductase [Niabella ginsengisoli]
MKRIDFIKTTAAGSLAFMLPLHSLASNGKKLRIAQVGLGMMGTADLKDIASHPAVEVVALCDVDMNKINAVKATYASAKIFTDYREMLKSIGKDIDAVVVSTPDHAHAPVALMAMEMNKNVYCQKPLTHYISESRKMEAVAAQKN